MVDNIRSHTLSVAYLDKVGTWRICGAGASSTLLLKTVSLDNTRGAANTVQLQLVYQGLVAFIGSSALAAGAVEHTASWLVFEDEAEVRVHASAAGCVVWLSGTVLRGSFDATVTFLSPGLLLT